MVDQEFSINDCGVVLNPAQHSYVVKNYMASTRIAVVEDKWYAGYNVFLPNGGCSVPVQLGEDYFSTEKDALNYSVECIKEYLQDKFNDDNKKVADVSLSLYNFVVGKKKKGQLMLFNI